MIDQKTARKFLDELKKTDDLCRVGYCPICRNTGILCQDHDHVSDRIRGMICRKCNLALGLLQDDPGVIERAAEYLKYWKLKDIFGTK